MIVIAQPYARFEKSLSDDRLKAAATRLLEYTEKRARTRYAQRFGIDAPIHVEADLEQGSTRALATVLLAFGVLTHYGEIRHSIDYLVKDAKWLGDHVLPVVSELIGIPDKPVVTQRRLGVPGQLQRLFTAVERHEITPQEATSRAVEILEHGSSDAETVESPLRRQFQRELSKARLHSHRLPSFPPHPKRQQMDVIAPTIRWRKGITARRDDTSGLITYEIR